MSVLWKRLKVLLAGIRLNHLVQQDRIWDRCNMAEQIEDIFFQMGIARVKNDPESLRKYLSLKGYEKIKSVIGKFQAPGKSDHFKNYMFTRAAIIWVKQGKKKEPDRVTALVKGKRVAAAYAAMMRKLQLENFEIQNFSERWHLVRHGDRWLLDEIR